MILIIENAPVTPHQFAVDTMFIDRKALFVDLFGWDVPVVDGRFEIDQFDSEHAIYLVAVDSDGAHEASLRLLPTERPHMLDTLFRNLCPLGVPTGPTIWESTRLCLPQRHGAGRRKQLREALISAMVDFALARGITRFTGVLPEAFRKDVLAMGWLAEPLGPSIRIPGGPIGAFAAHIAPDTPERLRWTGIYSKQLGDAA
jgi:acyl-homoserine lactone synthase